MATTTILQQGSRNCILHITGTGGDSAVNICDVSALNPPCEEVRILKCKYDVSGSAGLVSILWHATSNTTALTLSTGSGQTLDFTDIGGLKSNAGAGKTGDVLLTSSASTSFTIILHLKKVRPTFTL